MGSDLMDAETVGKTVADAIHSQLRDRILRGDFRPGGLLRQEELAKQFGASRVPLREAMTRLEAEGLLVLRPRRGYAVRSLDPNEIMEIFELRAVVEEHLGGIAATKRTDADLAKVEVCLLHMEAIARERPDDTSGWLDANSAFHDALLAATHRRQSARFASLLRDQVEPYIRIEMGLSNEGMQAETEHREMFVALCRSDKRALRKLCRDHCEHTASRLINALKAR